jgi:hypothetical protein
VKQHAADGIDATRTADVTALFTACQQTIRADIIKYILTADPSR